MAGRWEGGCGFGLVMFDTLNKAVVNMVLRGGVNGPAVWW